MSEIVDRLTGIADDLTFVKHADRVRSDDWRRGMSRAISVVLQARGRQLAVEAYASGDWCGECQFGVIEDPPCCTKPDTVIQCGVAVTEKDQK